MPPSNTAAGTTNADADATIERISPNMVQRDTRIHMDDEDDVVDDGFVLIPIDEFQAVLDHMKEICLILQAALNDASCIVDAPEEFPLLRIVKKNEPERGH